jgi:hypothetical protein
MGSKAPAIPALMTRSYLCMSAIYVSKVKCGMPSEPGPVIQKVEIFQRYSDRQKFDEQMSEADQHKNGLEMAVFQ